MWKLERDEDFFRIYDSKKLVAGYFDPDYGDVFPKENYEEIVLTMIKSHEKISGGVIMVPLVKLGFSLDLDITISEVENNISRISEHLQKWKQFMNNHYSQIHSVRISHTDHYMLTITFQIKFSKLTSLDEKQMMEEIFPTLDLLQKSGLL